jgi:hypothetical protein
MKKFILMLLLSSSSVLDSILIIKNETDVTLHFQIWKNRHEIVLPGGTTSRIISPSILSDRTEKCVLNFWTAAWCCCGSQFQQEYVVSYDDLKNSIFIFKQTRDGSFDLEKKSERRRKSE